jgi:hypothetical protein
MIGEGRRTSSKPFDATLKDMLEISPEAWAARFCPGPFTSAAFIDADVSTVTAASDKVLRVERPAGPLLVDLNAESWHAADAPGRMHLYSTLLTGRYDLPVRSVLLLLRREANASNLTGVLELRESPNDPEPYLIFRYHVVRLWQEPLEPLLTGPAALLPLAPLTDEAAADLPGTVERVVRRLRAETPRDLAGKMEMAAFVLLGLRYTEEVLRPIFERCHEMEESSTYQAILRKGEARCQARALRRALLGQGRHRNFGEPGKETVTDLDRLNALTERVLDVNTWDDLLAE